MKSLPLPALSALLVLAAASCRSTPAEPGSKEEPAKEQAKEPAKMGSTTPAVTAPAEKPAAAMPKVPARPVA